MSLPPVLITGVAGFIGNALALRFLEAGRQVVGLDNVNAYYDVGLKEARLRRLDPFPGYSFARLDLTDTAGLDALFVRHGFRTVVHLAAQAGVRYSLTNPQAYAASNLVGFLNILEACRHGGVEHLLYASSSSVYGAVTTMPFSIHQNVDHPVSLYAATKKANELMAHSYSHLYRLPTTGLRFFTVYGPWGRPDMAMSLFARAILAGEPIQVFNEGRMRRDFTYIDDIVEGVVRLLFKPSAPAGKPPHSIFNIGNNQPVQVLDFIRTLENAFEVKAELDFQPMQPGDVPATHADTGKLQDWVGYKPTTSLEAGLREFARWYNQTTRANVSYLK